MARKQPDHFARVRDAAAGLPSVEQGTSYGTPALKVRGRMFVRLKEDGETLVAMCPLDEKEMLIAADPQVYFETDHYKGWPAVLVRLKKVSARKLRYRLEQSWGLKAPKTLVAQFDKSR